MLRSRSLFSKFRKIKCSRPATVSYIINHEIVSNKIFLHTSKNNYNSSSDYYSQKYKENFNNNKLLQNKQKFTSTDQIETKKQFGNSIITRNNLHLDNEKLPLSNALIMKNGSYPKEYIPPNRKVTHISRKVSFKREISKKKFKGPQVINKYHGIVKSKKLLGHNLNNIKTNQSQNYFREETVKTDLKLNHNNKNNTEESKFQNYIGETQNQLKPNNIRLGKHSKYMKYFERDESAKRNFENNNAFQAKQIKSIETENDILNSKSNIKYKNRFNIDSDLYQDKSEHKYLKNNSQQKSHSVHKKSSKTTNDTRNNENLVLEDNSAIEKSKVVPNNKQFSKHSKLYMNYLQQEANNSNVCQFQEHNAFGKQTLYDAKEFETENTKCNKVMMKQHVLSKKSYSDPAIIKNQTEIKSKSVKYSNNKNTTNFEKSANHEKASKIIENDQTFTSDTITSVNCNDLKKVSVFQIQAEARKLYSKFLNDKKCNDNKKNMLNTKKTKACLNMFNETTNDPSLRLIRKYGVTGTSTSSTFIPSNLKSPRSYNITKRANSTHNFPHGNCKTKREKLNSRTSNNNDKNSRTRDRLMKSKSVDTGIKQNNRTSDVKSNLIQHTDKLHTRSKSAVSFKTPSSLNTSQRPKTFKVNSMHKGNSDRSKSNPLKNDVDTNDHKYNINKYGQKADIVEQFHNVKHKYEQAGSLVSKTKNITSDSNSVYFQGTSKKKSNCVNNSGRPESKTPKNNFEIVNKSYQMKEQHRKGNISEQLKNVEYNYKQLKSQNSKVKNIQENNTGKYKFKGVKKNAELANKSFHMNEQKSDIEKFNNMKPRSESGFSTSKIKNISLCTNAIVTEREKPEDCFAYDTRQIREHTSVPNYNKNIDSENTLNANDFQLKIKSKHDIVHRRDSLIEPQLNDMQTFNTELESVAELSIPIEITNKRGDKLDRENSVKGTKINEKQNKKSNNTVASKSGTIDKYNKYKEQFKILEQTSHNNFKEELESDSIYSEVRYEQNSKPENEPQKCSKFKKYDKLTNEIIAKMGTSPPKPKKKIPVKFTTAVCRTKFLRNPIIPFKDTKLNPQIQINTKAIREPKQLNKSNSEIKGTISKIKEKPLRSKKEKAIPSVNNTEVLKSKDFGEKTVLPKSSDKEVIAAITNTKAHKPVPENKGGPYAFDKQKEISPRNKKVDKSKSVQKPREFKTEEIKEEQVETFKQNKIFKKKEGDTQTDYSSQCEIKGKQFATNDPFINELNSQIASDETTKNLQKFKAVPSTRLHLTNKLIELSKLEQNIDFHNTTKKDKQNCIITDKISKFNLKPSNDIPLLTEKQAKNIKTSDSGLKTENIEGEKRNNSLEQLVEVNTVFKNQPKPFDSSISISKNKPSKLSSKQEITNTLLENEEKDKQNKTPIELKKQLRDKILKGKQNRFENNKDKQIEYKNNYGENKDLEFKMSSTELGQKPLITTYLQTENNSKTKSKYLNETKYNNKTESPLTTNPNAIASNETQKSCSYKLKVNSNPVRKQIKLTDKFKTDKNRIKKERNINKNIRKSGKSQWQKKSSVKSNLSTKSTILKSKSFSKSGQDKKHVHHQNISFKHVMLNNFCPNDYTEMSNQFLISLQQKPTLLDKFSNLITNIEPFLINLPEHSLLDPPASVFKKIKYNPFKNANSKRFTNFRPLIKPKEKCELNDISESIIVAKSPTSTKITQQKINTNSVRNLKLNTPPQSPKLNDKHKIELTDSKSENIEELLTGITNNNSKFIIKKKCISSLNKKKSDSKLKDPLIINRSLNKRGKSMKFTMSLRGKKHYRLLTTSPLKRNNLKNNGTGKKINLHKTDNKYIETGFRNNKKNYEIQTTCLGNLGADNLILDSKKSLKSFFVKNRNNDFFNVITESKNISNNETFEVNDSIKTETDSNIHENTTSKINTANIFVTAPFKIKQESKDANEFPKVEQIKESDIFKNKNQLAFFDSNCKTVSNSSCENQTLIKSNKISSVNEDITTGFPLSTKIAKSSKIIQQSTDQYSTSFSDEEKNEKEISVYEVKNKSKDSTSHYEKDDNTTKSALTDHKDEVDTPTIFSSYKVLSKSGDMKKYDNNTPYLMKQEKICDNITLKSEDEMTPKEERVLKPKNDQNSNNTSLPTSTKNVNKDIDNSDTETFSFLSNDKKHYIKDFLISKSKTDININLPQPPNKNESAVNTKNNNINLVKFCLFNNNIKLKNINPKEIEMSLLNNSENKKENETVVQMEFEISSEKVKDSETKIGFKDRIQDLGKSLEKLESKIRNASNHDEPKFKKEDKIIFESEARNNLDLTVESIKSKTKENVSTTAVLNDFLNLNINACSKSSGEHEISKLDISEIIKPEIKNRNKILTKDHNTESITPNKTEGKDTIYDPNAKYEKTFFLPSNIKIVYSPKNEHKEDQSKINDDKQRINNNKVSQNNNTSSKDSNINSDQINNFFKKSLFNRSKNIKCSKTLPLSVKNDDGNGQHQVENKKLRLRPEISSFNEKRIESKFSSLEIEQKEYDAIMNFLKTETTDTSLFGSKLLKNPPIVTGFHSYNEEQKMNKKQSITLKNHSNSGTNISEETDTKSVDIKTMCSKVNDNKTNINKEQEKKSNAIPDTEMASLTLNNENTVCGVTEPDGKLSRTSTWLASIFPSNKTNTSKTQELLTYFTQSSSASRSDVRNIENTSHIKKLESNINCNKNDNNRNETDLNLDNTKVSNLDLHEKKNSQDNTSKSEFKNSFWIDSVLPKYQQQIPETKCTKSEYIIPDSNLKTSHLREQKEFLNGGLAKIENVKLNNYSMSKPKENIQNFIPDKKLVRSYVKYDNILKRVKSESLLKCDTQSLETPYYKTIDKHLTFSKSKMSSKECTESDSSTNKTLDNSNYLRNNNKEKTTDKGTISKNIAWVASVIPNYQNRISERENKKMESRELELNNSLDFLAENRRKDDVDSNSKSDNLLHNNFKKCSILKKNENTKKSTNNLIDKKTFWLDTIFPSCHEIQKKIGDNASNITGSNSCSKITDKKVETKEIKTLLPLTISHEPSPGQNISKAQQNLHSESTTGCFEKDKNKTRDVSMINAIERNPLWVETVGLKHENESKIEKKALEVQETQNVIHFPNDSKITEHSVFDNYEHKSTLEDNTNSNKRCHGTSTSFQTRKGIRDELCHFSDLTVTKSETTPELNSKNIENVSQLTENAKEPQSNNIKTNVEHTIGQQLSKASFNIELPENPNQNYYNLNNNNMNEEDKNKLHCIQRLLQKHNKKTSKSVETDQTNDSKLLNNLSNEEYVSQRNNKEIKVVKTTDIMDGSNCIGTKFSTETILIDQSASNTKHNVVVFEREIQNSALAKAIHSLNDTSNRNVYEENKENQFYRTVLDKASLKSKETDLPNKTEVTTLTIKQHMHNMEKKLTADKSNIGNYTRLLENRKLDKINFLDHQKCPTTGFQTNGLIEQSSGRIDVKLKNVKIDKENIPNIESAFLVLQGQVNLPQVSDLESKITVSANEAQIGGEIEISCRREKSTDKNASDNQLIHLEYKHDITSFLKDSRSIYSNKMQTHLIQHLERTKSLINNSVAEHKLQQVNTIKKSKSESMGLDIKSKNDLKTSRYCNQRNKEDQNSQLTKKSLFSFQFMKHTKNESCENSTKTVKLASKELNSIIDDVKKPVNVTINDYHEKQKGLSYTSKNITKFSENIKLLNENVKMSKTTTVIEDDKRTKHFKNKDNVQKGSVISTKIPLIIIDEKKPLNSKRLLTKAVESSISVCDPKGKFAYPIENYPLENKKRSKTYYPLVIINIKSLKLKDLPLEAQKFHDVYEILSFASHQTSLDSIDKKREIVKDLHELALQKDLTLQEIVFKKRLHRFLMVKSLKSKDDVFLNSLNWTWPYFTSVSAVKSYTFHPGLFYKGVITCVAKFKDHPVIVEWKLLNNPTVKPVIPEDAALRLSALMGALNYDNNFNFQVTKGIVIIAYLSGDPADMFILSSQNCQVYWKTWLTQLKNYLVTYNNK